MPPIESRLRVMTFTNGHGEQGALHAGEVRFPLSAVAPGAAVMVTAIPDGAPPLVTTLEAARLQLLKELARRL